VQRARAFEDGLKSAKGREADASASRPTPLTLVAGAVAGGSLDSVAAIVSSSLSCPVAIVIPALGEPVIEPAGSLPAAAAKALVAYAAGMIAADKVAVPALIADAVTVQIAEQIVGIVAAVAIREPSGSPASVVTPGERRAWLEAAAAAASVTALIQEAHAAEPGGSAADLLAELSAGPPADLQAFLARGRRLGVELSGGGIAISARRVAGDGSGLALTGADRAMAGELGGIADGLIATRGADRMLAIVAAHEASQALTERLHDAGLSAVASAMRRAPALLHEAVLEAELLGELGGSELAPAGAPETYRLLIGVLLRDRSELEQLRDRTVWPLFDYDRVHDTELVATLRAFLSHDGSTTETAEAMQLHRHTVGYRLSRVHEVSGLSPYESDGRERLSLGIKASQILEAERRLRERL
jgi:PucR C-terminal helix-turn-helix domain